MILWFPKVDELSVLGTRCGWKIKQPGLGQAYSAGTHMKQLSWPCSITVCSVPLTTLQMVITLGRVHHPVSDSSQKGCNWDLSASLLGLTASFSAQKAHQIKLVSHGWVEWKKNSKNVYKVLAHDIQLCGSVRHWCFWPHSLKREGLS